jgi:hypothetical protein
MADEKLPREGVRFDTKDIAAGVVYEANGAKVTAFEVDHGEVIKPLSQSETYALKYWWCSPPRTGIASVRPTVWIVRGIGASLCSDRCVRASL